MRYNKVTHDPSAKTKPIEYRPPEPKPLPSETDTKAVQKIFPQVGPLRWYYFFTVVKNTCCRLISARRLRWIDIQFDKRPDPTWEPGYIVLRHYKGKTRELKKYAEYAVPMTSELHRALKE
jgi:integrase